MSKFAPHRPSANNPRATPQTLCQRCLKRGHFTYQCKNERPYVSRPSRTQMLSNPKLAAKVKPEGEVPAEFKNKSGMANKILEAKEKERAVPKAIESGKRKRHDSESESTSDSDSESTTSSESGSESSSESDSDSDASSSDSSSVTESTRSRSRNRSRNRHRSRNRSRSRSVPSRYSSHSGNRRHPAQKVRRRDYSSSRSRSRSRSRSYSSGDDDDRRYKSKY